MSAVPTTCTNSSRKYNLPKLEFLAQMTPDQLVGEGPTVVANKLPCANQWAWVHTDRYAVHHNMAVYRAVHRDSGEKHGSAVKHVDLIQVQ